MKKQILWIRKLSCGHERATSLAFISKIYVKPNIGDNAYCRECCQEVKITDVYEADKQIVSELKSLMKSIK